MSRLDNGQNAPRHYGILEILYVSMLGKQPDPERTWTPLTVSDIHEGWFDPWIAPPNGSGGSLRQGWINIQDPYFNRMVVGTTAFTKGTPGTPDQYTGGFIYETPITRRYLFGVVLNNLQTGPASATLRFGDITLENRFLLEETVDTTLSFNFNVRIPSGDPSIGGGRTILNPYLALYQDLGRGFSVRLVEGAYVPVDSRPDSIEASAFTQLGLGQTLLPHDVPLLGDFTYFLVANFQHDWKDNGVPNHTIVSLTPGFRTHLGHNFFLLAGVQLPVTSPRPFDEQVTVFVVKGF